MRFGTWNIRSLYKGGAPGSAISEMLRVQGEV